MHSEPATEVPLHEELAERRQKSTFAGITLQHVLIALITMLGWLWVLAGDQSTLSEHGRRLDKIEEHQDRQEQILMRIAERVGAKTD